MAPIDIPTIERQARAMRAAEMRRLHGLFAERLALLLRLLAGSVLAGACACSDMLRPLFSWNPQASQAPIKLDIEPAVSRLNFAARALFSWNPQERRS